MSERPKSNDIPSENQQPNDQIASTLLKDAGVIDDSIVRINQTLHSTDDANSVNKHLDKLGSAKTGAEFSALLNDAESPYNKYKKALDETVFTKVPDGAGGEKWAIKPWPTNDADKKAFEQALMARLDIGNAEAAVTAEHTGKVSKALSKVSTMMEFAIEGAAAAAVKGAGAGINKALGDKANEKPRQPLRGDFPDKTLR